MPPLGDEATLLQLATQLEQAQPWFGRLPTLARLRRPAWNAICMLRWHKIHYATGRTMLDSTITRNTTRDATQFSHTKPADTAWRSDGLRDFFLYKDLGIERATAGRVIAQLVKANKAPDKGTGWHRHEAQFHIVIMTKGWAKFMYGDVQTLVEAGDCVHQRPGIVHFLFDYSPDMEYIEIVGPAGFTTLDAHAPCAVPAPQAW